MSKRLISAAISIAAVGAAGLSMAPAAMAATGANGGACALQGTANFTTPLTATSGPFGYTFTGSLSNCNSGTTGGLNSGPASGTIATIGTASGSGSCTSSTTQGIAEVKWSDGKTTVEKYTTTGAGAAVVLQGSVLASYTYQSGVDSSGNPILTTVTTTEPSTPAGDSTGGPLAFAPSDPQDCEGSGVKTAPIYGAIGTGN